MINRRPTGIDLTSDPHSRSPKATDTGRRILTWAPEPVEDYAPEPVEPEPAPAEEVRRQPAAPTSAAPTATPRRVPKRIPKRHLVLPGGGSGTVARPPAAAPRPAAPPKPAAPPPEAPAADSEPTEAAARKRGRPRGRAVRRQVHFHVDPLEEQLLVDAVEVYGSQQKALIAALQALKETERLHDEIDALRDECARQRRLLQEAKALFKP